MEKYEIIIRALYYGGTCGGLREVTSIPFRKFLLDFIKETRKQQITNFRDSVGKFVITVTGEKKIRSSRHHRDYSNLVVGPKNGVELVDFLTELNKKREQLLLLEAQFLEKYRIHISSSSPSARLCSDCTSLRKIDDYIDYLDNLSTQLDEDDFTNSEEFLMITVTVREGVNIFKIVADSIDWGAGRSNQWVSKIDSVIDRDHDGIVNQIEYLVNKSSYMAFSKRLQDDLEHYRSNK